jgi:hypothetical protein
MHSDKDTAKGRLSRASIGIGMALVLVFSVVSTIATIEMQAAFAEKGGKSDKEKQSENSKDEKSKSSTTGTNSTETEEEEYDGHKGKAADGKTKEKSKDTTDKETTKPAWAKQLNETADEIHAKHLKMNAEFAGPYTANLTYSVMANGTAEAIGNSTYDGDSALSLEMSIWKSTPNQVRMDVIEGTVSVHNKTMDVHSGHAHYWIKTNRLLIIAFVTEDGVPAAEIDSNVTGTNQTAVVNQTTTTNQTSTDVPEIDEVDMEPQVRVLKLWMTMPAGAEGLPNSESPEPAEILTMSPQSKLASLCFLEMSGEVTLST